MGRERKESEFLQRVGQKLRQVRLEKKYTQEYVYDETKINLDRIENAKINYTLSTLYILCKFYEISLDDFFKEIE